MRTPAVDWWDYEQVSFGFRVAVIVSRLKKQDLKRCLSSPGPELTPLEQEGSLAS